MTLQLPEEEANAKTDSVLLGCLPHVSIANSLRPEADIRSGIGQTE